jgi:hypothetical protein
MTSQLVPRDPQELKLFPSLVVPEDVVGKDKSVRLERWQWRLMMVCLRQCAKRLRQMPWHDDGAVTDEREPTRWIHLTGFPSSSCSDKRLESMSSTLWDDSIAQCFETSTVALPLDDEPVDHRRLMPEVVDEPIQGVVDDWHFRQEGGLECEAVPTLPHMEGADVSGIEEPPNVMHVESTKLRHQKIEATTDDQWRILKEEARHIALFDDAEDMLDETCSKPVDACARSHRSDVLTREAGTQDVTNDAMHLVDVVKYDGVVDQPFGNQ